VGVDHHYYRWDETFPTSAESWDLQNGRIPMVSLGGASTFPGLDAINDGSQDARLHAIAQGFRSLGGEVFFRPWWEMNGDWYPWDGSHNNDPGTTDGPAKYVQAWRRMHDIFVQEGATNVVWVWAPDAEDSPSAGWNHWANYYPGDAYVDWVGIDGYNWGTTQTWSSWQSFASIFGNVYGDYAASKPLMVAETSSCEQGGDKAQWIRDAAAAIKTQLTAIRAWIWFDENVECDWRVNTSQSALDAYKQVGADPYFNPGVASSGDTQAPSAPASLAVTSTSTSSIALSWSASSDNVGVAGYNVYANGTRIATTTSTSYSFTGLSCGTSYTLAVDAYDAAGNRSSASSVTAATSACPADTSPPTAPANLAVTGTGASSIALSWGASSDNVAVTGYDVYLNSTKIATTTQTGYSFTGLNCGSSYTLGVDAYDAAGNVSSRSTLTAATSACAATSGPCGTATTPPATYQHVIWIWMENKAYGEIIGSSSAPYENSLANQCGLATNYSAITHPSLPNYIAATSGDYWGISDDNPPSSHPLSVGSIYSQVKAAGKSWRDYEENAPGNCPLDSSYPYAVKHDPAPYYTNIRTDCANWDVPMGTTSGGNFLNDLNNNSLPAFSFITPDLCNDTHDCAVSTGDDWLASWLPKIFACSAYQSGSTAVFITWDEDDGSTSNHVATIVASAYTPAGTRSSTAYNHYSLLRTTEQLLGINTYLAHAGDTTTNSMRTDFHL
jgi:chitodextrinase